MNGLALSLFWKRLCVEPSRRGKIRKSGAARVLISPELLEQVQSESKVADKGRATSLERGARMIAVLKASVTPAHTLGVRTMPGTSAG